MSPDQAFWQISCFLIDPDPKKLKIAISFTGKTLQPLFAERKINKENGKGSLHSTTLYWLSPEYGSHVSEFVIDLYALCLLIVCHLILYPLDHYKQGHNYTQITIYTLYRRVCVCVYLTDFVLSY